MVKNCKNKQINIWFFFLHFLYIGILFCLYYSSMTLTSFSVLRFFKKLINLLLELISLLPVDSFTVIFCNDLASISFLSVRHFFQFQYYSIIFSICFSFFFYLLKLCSFLSFIPACFFLSFYLIFLPLSLGFLSTLIYFSFLSFLFFLYPSLFSFSFLRFFFV